MISVDDTFEVAGNGFSECAEIYVNTHKNRNKEPADEMKQVGIIQSADAKNAANGYFGIKQSDPRYDQQRKDDIHDGNIGELLERIEFGFHSDRERCIFMLENAYGIMVELGLQPFKIAFHFNDII